jgi:hypothetical protein
MGITVPLDARRVRSIVCALNQIVFALDASGKSGAYRHHREYRTARAGKSAAGFLFGGILSARTVLICPNCFIAFSAFCLRPRKEFDTSGKSLT